MLEFLAQVDTALFRFINITLANPVTDRLMPFVTDGGNWVLAVLLAVAILVHSRRWASLPILLGVAVVFAACDQAAAHLIKPLVGRVRPCHVVEGVHLLVGCSQAGSFPSAHAANWFGCALFLSWAVPRWRWVYFALAGLVSLSRVFVGVHYPSDVLGGFVVGAVISAVVIAGFRALRLDRGFRDPAGAARPLP